MAAKEFNDWTADDKAYLGTILATTVFKCILQGVLFAATHRYYSRTCSQDGTKLRTFIGAVMALEVLHTSIVVAKLYLVAIDHIFWKAYWLNPLDTTLNGTICFMSQLFFAHRCWRVTHRSTPVLCILILSTAVIFAGDVGVMVNEWLSFRGMAHNTAVLQGLIAAWGFASAIYELLVTAILFRFFWKSRTGIKGLDKIILRLITVSFESSFPCLVFVLLTNLTVLLKNVSSNFFAYSTATLYGLSIMISLNCREKIENSFVQFRREGAFIDFIEPSNPANITDSQLFSEAGNTSRRPSTAVGSDIQEFRRPSILSFVKEVF